PRTLGVWAAGARTNPGAGRQVIGCWMNPKPGDPLPTRGEDFAGAVSFEAWILPQEKESGRVLDKLTAGKQDGFLLDTWPGLSLRLIVGSQTQQVPNVLKPGVWQHVAIVMERGISRLYLDGQPARNTQ
ncbi:MAG: LamG-like jellyroll fold domain-containing protein, partial [Thermoguttaceae bacterium]